MAIPKVADAMKMKQELKETMLLTVEQTQGFMRYGLA